jgi:hypothetical protein
MFSDQPFDPTQLRAAKATAVRQPGRSEPELGSASVSLDVYVGRLVAVSGVEEEPVRAGYRDRRHGPFYLTRRAARLRALRRLSRLLAPPLYG